MQLVPSPPGGGALRWFSVFQGAVPNPPASHRGKFESLAHGPCSFVEAGDFTIAFQHHPQSVREIFAGLCHRFSFGNRPRDLLHIRGVAASGGGNKYGSQFHAGEITQAAWPRNPVRQLNFVQPSLPTGQQEAVVDGFER